MKLTIEECNDNKMIDSIYNERMNRNQPVTLLADCGSTVITGFVAFYENDPAGCVVLRRDTAHSNRIEMMTYVKEKREGEGVAYELTKVVCKYLTTHYPKESLVAKVKQSNTRASNRLQRFGFIKTPDSQFGATYVLLPNEVRLAQSKD